MLWTEIAFGWFAQVSFTCLVVLVFGTVVAACTRQPVRRIRIIVLTFATCFVIPWLSLVPGIPRWSLPRPGQLSSMQSLKKAPPPILDRPGERRDFVNPSTPAATEPATQDASVSSDTAAPTDGPQLPAEVPQVDPVSRRPRPTVDEQFVDSSAADAILPFGEVAPNPPHQEADLPRVRKENESVSVSPPISSTAQHELLPVPQSSTPSAFTFPWPGQMTCELALGLNAAGVVIMGSWWLVGVFALRRMLQTATPAPDFCRTLLMDIAGPAASKVKVLISPRAPQPFTFSVLRPTIVLSERLIADGDDDSLRWCLAHEWSHIVRRDTAMWALAGMARIVFFFQPLVWWLRRELRLCQDYVADAFAAGDSAPAYAEFLATRAVGRRVVVGLGIGGGRSDLYRRVLMLFKESDVKETHCPRWWTAVAVAFVGGVALAVGTFRFLPEVMVSLAASEERQIPVPAPSKDAPRLRNEMPPVAHVKGRVTLDGKPLAQATVFMSPVSGHSRLATTNEAGEYELTTIPGRSGVAFRANLGRAVLPREYVENTGIAVELKHGDNFQNFELRSDYKRPAPPSVPENVGPSRPRLFDAMPMPFAQAEADPFDPPKAPTPDAPSSRPAALPRALSKELLDQVLERAGALTSGRMEVEVTRRLNGRSIYDGALQSTIVFSGKSWKTRTTSSRKEGASTIMTEAFHRGRGIGFTEMREREEGPTEMSGNRSGRRTNRLDLKIEHALFDLVPESVRRGGTLGNERIEKFVRANALTVRQVRSDKIGGEPVTILDCPFPREKTREVYPMEGTLLDLGGAIRMTVLADRKGALARLDLIDRWETVQVSWVFTDFVELPKGLHYPRMTKHVDGESEYSNKLVNFELINETIPERDFKVPVPVGTRVRDSRYPPGPQQPDPFAPAGSAPMDPLREFITRTEYPEGLPEALLEEMDAAVAKAIGQTKPIRVTPSASVGASETKSPKAEQRGSSVGELPEPSPTNERPLAGTSPQDHSGNRTPPGARDKLRYGGRSFDEWRTTLLTDLEDETRLKAIKAISELGPNGYQKEAAVALGETLRADKPSSNEGKVLRAGCEALSRLGEEAIPQFETLLERDGLSRSVALSGLARSRSNAAVPTLLKAAGDEDYTIRSIALHGLALNPTGEETLTILSEAIETDDRSIREAIALGLEKAGAVDAVLPLIQRLLEDSSPTVRMHMIHLVARGTTSSDELPTILRSVVLPLDSNQRLDILRDLANNAALRNPEILVPLLTAILEQGLESKDLQFAIPETGHAISGLAKFGPKSASAVPALIKALQRPLLDGKELSMKDETARFYLELRQRQAAAGALELIGPAAKKALPALKSALEDPLMTGAPTMVPEVPMWIKNCRRQLAGAIEKIEASEDLR
jgi:beta-lactamase regulating signal transducer with metallopeptidase domain/HEAT repeat protein